MSALNNTELLNLEGEVKYIITDEPEFIDTVLSYLELLTNEITSTRSRATGLSLIHSIVLPD
jgi:hypothetical protein